MILNATGDLQSTTENGGTSNKNIERRSISTFEHADLDPSIRLFTLIKRGCKVGVKHHSSGGSGSPPKPPSPRQRIELFSYPGAAQATTWKYEWKSYLKHGVSTGSDFFHLFQWVLLIRFQILNIEFWKLQSSLADMRWVDRTLRRDNCGGPVISLNAFEGNVAIQDAVRDCSVTKCPSLPLSWAWILLG